MQLIFERDELLTDHEYAHPHVIGEQRLHGGFDAEDTYIPPRSKIRTQAIDNWLKMLRERGGDLLDADSSLLIGPRVPNIEQQRLLIREGLSQTFWNGLTIIGKIEGRGRMLAEMPLPNLQTIIEEDISEMAIGHLHKGLMFAHGIDEGGEPEKGIGGHDVMWFVVRDLVFGEDAWPDVEPPGRVAREESNNRRMPEVPQPVETLLSFLMNLLVIEFRAEIGFALTQEVLRTPDLFRGRREEAELAANIVERIRTDERIHVDLLRLYLGEMRTVQFKSESGTVSGQQLIDPFWSSLIEWATTESPKQVARQQYENICQRIDKHESAAEIQKRFDALNDPGFMLAAAG